MAGALTAAIASIFSGSAVTADPYFEYTTLLLPGSGTNGAQNNTFLDSSTNNFTITRNGNTTQGTFSPFSQTGWGNYFGGSGNYLKVADGTALDLPGDFTLEGWFYFSSLSSNNGIIGYGSEAASQNGFSLYWAASSVNKLRIYSNGATLLTGTTTLSANTWNHIAIVRSGSGSNNLTVYVNGAVDQTATNTTSFTGVAALGMGIGVNYDGTFYNPFTGYASNIRLVKGQALATGAFTPPTSPVSTSSVGWTGANAAASLTGTVSVLTCQSNRFVDNSSSPLAITVTGSPSVQAFSPFNPTASWSAATNGGSGYFDGSADFLTGPTNNSAFDFGSGLFTIEFWIYPVALSTIATIVCSLDSATGSALAFGVQVLTDGSVKTLQWGGSSYFLLVTSTAGVVKLNAWNHVAVVRNGANFGCFVNGNREGSSTTISGTQVTNATLNIGRDPYGSGSLYPYGYLSSLRVVKGTAVYDPTQTSITVPTAPLTAITNTSLLLNFTNAGIYDATSKNDLETVGDAQISNAVTPKWGSTSIKFDGTGDYLQSPDIELVEFGSGDFTIETWVRFAALPSSGAYYALVSKWDNSTQKSYLWYVYNLSGAYQLYFTYTTNGSTNINPIAAITPSINTWYHYAVSRSGANLRMFIDGTQVGSTYNIATDTIFGGTYPLQVGASTGANTLNGYMQDVRVTKGYARYTANFTAPTAAFPTL